jgi:signal transduction histidine kinase
MEKEAALGKMAQQVGHDIRSPLAVLEFVLKDLGNVEKLSLAQSAIKRMRDIVTDIGDFQKDRAVMTPDLKALQSNPVNLTLLVREIFKEKNIEWSEKLTSNLKFELRGAEENYFAKVDSKEFLRLLSNLLNNAYEALGAEGLISMELSEGSSWIRLSIKDNGCGMSEEVLQKIGTRGYSFGKSESSQSGQGLGIFHAKSKILEWGGQFEVFSQKKLGSEILIKLPSILN